MLKTKARLVALEKVERARLDAEIEAFIKSLTDEELVELRDECGEREQLSPEELNRQIEEGRRLETLQDKVFGLQYLHNWVLERRSKTMTVQAADDRK